MWAAVGLVGAKLTEAGEGGPNEGLLLSKVLVVRQASFLGYAKCDSLLGDRPRKERDRTAIRQGSLAAFEEVHCLACGLKEQTGRNSRANRVQVGIRVTVRRRNTSS